MMNAASAHAIAAKKVAEMRAKQIAHVIEDLENEAEKIAEAANAGEFHVRLSYGMSWCLPNSEFKQIVCGFYESHGFKFTDDKKFYWVEW